MCPIAHVPNHQMGKRVMEHTAIIMHPPALVPFHPCTLPPLCPPVRGSKGIRVREWKGRRVQGWEGPRLGGQGWEGTRTGGHKGRRSWGQFKVVFHSPTYALLPLHPPVLHLWPLSPATLVSHHLCALPPLYPCILLPICPPTRGSRAQW